MNYLPHPAKGRDLNPDRSILIKQYHIDIILIYFLSTTHKGQSESEGEANQTNRAVISIIQFAGTLAADLPDGQSKQKT